MFVRGHDHKIHSSLIASGVVISMCPLPSLHVASFRVMAAVLDA
jgi:hypothetical protein